MLCPEKFSNDRYDPKRLGRLSNVFDPDRVG
jgi:hypothetical protein